MGYKSDIEIAQSVEMKPITEIAKVAGIDEKYLEQYGKYKAKIDNSLLSDSTKENGKLRLVEGNQSIEAANRAILSAIGEML